MANDTKTLKLVLDVPAPDTSKAADAFKRVGLAAKDAQEQVNKLSKAQQDVLRQEQRFGGPGIGTAGRSQIALGGQGIAQAAAMGGPAFPGQMVPGRLTPASAITGFRDAGRPASAASASLRLPGPQSPGPSSAISILPGQSPPHHHDLAEHNRKSSGEGSGIRGAVMAGIGTAGAGLGAIAGVAVAISGVTEALAAMQNPLATTNQKLIEAAKAVPLLGGVLGDLTTSVLSSVERLADWKGALALDEKRRNHPFEMRAYDAMATGEDRMRGLRRETRLAGFAFQSIQKYPSLASLGHPLAAVAGFGAFATAAVEDPRVRAAREAEQTARRDFHTAGLGAMDAHNEQAEIRRAVGLAQEKYDAARFRRFQKGQAAGVGNFGGPTQQQGGGSFLGGALVAMGLGGVGKNNAYEKAHLEEAKALQALNRENARLEQAGLLSKERSLDLIRKEYELRKSTTGVLRAQLAVGQEKLDKTKALGTAFGSLDIFGQQAIYNASERYKKNGRMGVTNEELEQLRGLPLIGEKIDKELNNESNNNPMYKEVLKGFGIASQKDQEASVNKMQAQVEVRAQIDEEQFKKVLMETTQAMNGQLTGLINKIVLTQLQALQQEQARGAAGLK